MNGYLFGGAMTFQECCLFILQRQAENKRTFLILNISDVDYLVEADRCVPEPQKLTNDLFDEKGERVYWFISIYMLAKTSRTSTHFFSFKKDNFNTYFKSFAEEPDIFLFIGGIFYTRGAELLKNLYGLDVRVG